MHTRLFLPHYDRWRGRARLLVGDDAQIVVAGTHENGARITIAGLGAIGRDDKGSWEIEFGKMPYIAVVLPHESQEGTRCP